MDTQVETDQPEFGGEGGVRHLRFVINELIIYKHTVESCFLPTTHVKHEIGHAKLDYLLC